MPPLDDVWAARVGRRVVVRRRLPDGRLGDVLGELVDVDAERLHVATRRGPVAVERAAVVAGKVVPPRPTRMAPPHLALSITDLQAVMAPHWQAPDTEHLGGWLLRACGGFTNRANSVLPLADPGLPPAEALAFVQRWYAARDLPARASVAGPLPDGVFAAAGWTSVPGAAAFVLVAPTAELRPAGAVLGELTLDLTDEPDEAWLTAYRYRGQPLPPHARTLLMSAPEQVFASVRDGVTTVAVGRGSLADGWAGVTAVSVEPAYRRRGLARVLLASIAVWAWRGGALSTYLQVAESNEAALALYTSAGFTVHHRYDYLQASPS